MPVAHGGRLERPCSAIKRRRATRHNRSRPSPTGCNIPGCCSIAHTGHPTASIAVSGVFVLVRAPPGQSHRPGILEGDESMRG